MEDKDKKVEDKTEEIKDDVTREINLDDLYDGAVNNTVIIDPVSNNEILMSNKKPNIAILGIIMSILILLALYYIYNKTNLINKAGEVKNKPTTTITTKKVTDKGTLVCNYSSKSDAEVQDVSFNANYISDKITNTVFTFNATSNSEPKSAVIDNLQSQYETLYLNNVTVTGNNIEFTKNSNGFTISITTNYDKDGYDNINIVDGQTVLYTKPKKEDTIDSLKKSYEDKGFTCNITYDEGNKNE